jgi:uncharacterized protein YjbI with pentapeptide repeats
MVMLLKKMRVGGGIQTDPMDYNAVTLLKQQLLQPAALRILPRETWQSATSGTEMLVDFTSCAFANQNQINFQLASFVNTGKVTFKSALFTNQGDVNFEKVSFANTDGVHFDSVSFANKDEVIFWSVLFNNKKSVSFFETSFINQGEVTFQLASFANQGEVTFNNALFGNEGNVRFGDASFAGAKFLRFKDVWFLNTRILDWDNTEFPERLDLGFNNNLFLSRGGVRFTNIRFPEKGSVRFQRCYFNCEEGKEMGVDFSSARFVNAIFEGGNADWLEKYGPNDQNNMTVKALLENRLKEKFNQLPEKIRADEGLMSLKIPKFTPVFSDKTEVSWRDLTTESAKNITFRLTNLSRSIFDGTTLSHVQLNSPTWAGETAYGRRMLFEDCEWRREKECPSPDELKNLKDQYTQLKVNLEKQGHYRESGDFHYGEQEIHREILRKEGWRCNLFKRFLTWSYSGLSGYGERPLNAVCWFFGLFFLFSTVLSLGHSHFAFPPGKIYEIANRGGSRLLQSMMHLITPGIWKDIWKEELAISNMLYLGLLVIFQILLLGVQLPLLVLAVRRWFKR